MNNRNMLLQFFMCTPDMIMRVSLFISIMLHIAVISLVFLLGQAHAEDDIEQVQLESFKGELQLISFQPGHINSSEFSFKMRGENSYDTAASGDAINPDNPEAGSDAAGSVTNRDGIVKKNYESEVLKRIHRMKYYPKSAKSSGQEGVVKIKFTLYKNGTLCGDPEIIKACSIDILNKAGILTIIDAAPFPEFSADQPECMESRIFYVTIDYSISKL